MKLIALKLRNFKGKKELDINLDGKDASIFGDNATGKTTIKDGVSWLLFGKDSQGRAQFEIKTLDHDNRPYPKLDHSVEGTFKTDSDRVVTLKKVLKEKYTTPRGKSAEVFDGHTTSYFIDGAPKKKKDYTTKVAELTADETKFQLLTSPGYFPSMAWQSQRELLLDVCGGVSDADVIAGHNDLADLPWLMEERTLDEFRDMVASQRREAKKELAAIPGRVDEATRAIPQLEVKDPKPIVNKLKTLSKKLTAKDDEITSIRNGGGVTEKRMKLTEVDGAIAEARNKHKAGAMGEQDAKREQLRKERDSLEIELDDNNAEIKRQEGFAKDCAEEMARLEKAREAAGEEYTAVKKSEYDGSDRCPTCLQQLPHDKIEESKKRFNEEKANKLAKIVETGTGHKARIEQLQKEIGVHEEYIQQCEKTVTEYQQRIDTVKKELAALAETVTPFEDTDEHKKLMADRAAIEAEITSLQSGNTEALQKAKEQREVIQAEIDTNNAIISDINLAQKQHERIAELDQQQKALATQIEEHDRSLWLVEQFEKARAEALQEKVSSHFKFVTFKLFKTQINEGIQPTCEAMIDGVPYSNLNSAARVQAGLDIITTLSEYYGFHPPIMVDGAESFTSLPEMQAQVIRLIVSDADKELRVEVLA